MEKVRPWCGQPSDRGRLKNGAEENMLRCSLAVCVCVLQWKVCRISRCMALYIATWSRETSSAAGATTAGTSTSPATSISVPWLIDWCAFGALMLLVRRQEEHPGCRNWVMECWCGRLSAARCRLFAYGPANATAIPKPHHLLPHLNPDWFYLSGTGLPRLSWKRGR